jgi:DNA (cytosine-5)-methyltransferase 1
MVARTPESSSRTGRAYKVVDLFAGCGGISRGFEWTGRFSAELAVESWHHAARTYSDNIRTASGKAPVMHNGDIRELEANRSELWRLAREAGIDKPSVADVVVGGPPCQGFSRNGVRQYSERGDRFFDDPRNHLYRSFLACVEELSPTLVLIENVREFLNFGHGRFSGDLIEKLSELGYDAEFRKICVADFGVPQVRHRVFFVAMKRLACEALGIRPPFPDPTHGAAEGPSLFEGTPHRTVRDAIADLPRPVESHAESPQSYGARSPSEYASLLRSPSKRLHNHVARRLSQKSLARVRAVGTGRMRDIRRDLRTRSFYGSAYGRLSWDEPSLTITTWVYHVGSGRFAHPVEDRGLTMREAARLQSFDDEFKFPPLINPVSQIIGNAVPPMMAFAFAREFVRVLDALESNRRFQRLRSQSVGA